MKKQRVREKLRNPLPKFKSGNGCDVGRSPAGQLYLGKEHVYVWPVDDVGQTPGGAKPFDKTLKEFSSVDSPQQSF